MSPVPASRRLLTEAVAGRPPRALPIVGAAMMAMNVLSYAFTLVAAHLLGPRDFGALSSLLALLLVANVGSLALQATGARRLATAEPTDLGGVTADLLRSAHLVALALGALALATTPLIDRLLRLDDWLTAATVGLSCVPLTLMGGYAGVLQGRRRWRALAATYTALGVGRVVGGTVALAVDSSLRSAMVGVLVGSAVPAVVGRWLCRGDESVSGGHRPVLGELWRTGHSLLALYAFTNLDVLLARHLLSHHDAGVYAAGAVVAKACLFLPTFVLVVAFPTMAGDRSGRAWIKPLLAVLALGAVVVAVARLLPGLAVTFAGGSAYADLADVAWLFALEGTLFAALQILVYESIAGQSHPAFVVWLGALVVLVVAVPLIESPTVLVTLVTVVALGVGLVTSLMPGASDPD